MRRGHPTTGHGEEDGPTLLFRRPPPGSRALAGLDADLAASRAGDPGRCATLLGAGIPPRVGAQAPAARADAAAVHAAWTARVSGAHGPAVDPLVTSVLPLADAAASPLDEGTIIAPSVAGRGPARGPARGPLRTDLMRHVSFDILRDRRVIVGALLGVAFVGLALIIAALASALGVDDPEGAGAPSLSRSAAGLGRRLEAASRAEASG